MQKKTVASVVASTLVTTLAVVGVTYAATPAGNDTSLLNKGTVEVDSIKIGKQGVGGVTFFNGSIINATTNNGVDNPVTFADNVRIDGRVYRGETAGGSVGDSKPFVINDDAQVAGSLEVGGKDVFAEIATKASSSDVYTKTEVDSELGDKADSSDVYTKTEADANYVSKTAPSFNAQTRYVSVPAQAFTPIDESLLYDIDPQGSGTGLSIPSGTDVEFVAPVQFPHGAELQSATIHYVDNSAGAGIAAAIYRKVVASHTIASVFGFSSTENTALLSSKTDDTPSTGIATIDNDANTYWAFVRLGDTDTRFSNMKIEYTITQP